MRRRAGILVITLIVLTGIVSILAALASDRFYAAKAAINRAENLRARRAAQSGLERSIAELALVTSTSPLDTTGTWFELGSFGDDKFLVGRDSFRMQIVDAASMVSLNTATQEQLTTLGLTTEQIDSLLDWREAGDTPRAEGAKDSYYSTLTEPYNASLSRFQTVDELLLVKGFTPADLYDPLGQNQAVSFAQDRANITLYDLVTVDSYSPNTGKASINTAQLQQLVQAGIGQQAAAAIIATRNGLGGSFTGMGQVLQTPGLTTQNVGTLVDQFTVDAAPRVEGRLNVNTATLEALTSIPEITSDIADGILSRQSTGFQALSELLQVPGFSAQVMAAAIDRLAVGSDTFLVNVEGLAGRTRVSQTAVVRLINGTPQVVKIYDCPDTDMRARWGWQEEASNEVDLGAATE